MLIKVSNWYGLTGYKHKASCWNALLYQLPWDFVMKQHLLYMYCMYNLLYFPHYISHSKCWILFMTFIMQRSGNHFYSMCSTCCYEWFCCTFSHCCLQHECPNTPLCIPCTPSCPARLHKAYPMVIKVRQLDSASRGPGDLISIDNYLKLIWKMPLSSAALLSQILAGLQVITEYASTVLVWIMTLTMRLLPFHHRECDY